MVKKELTCNKNQSPSKYELYTFFQHQCRYEQYSLWIRFGVMVASQGALVGVYVNHIGGLQPAKPVILAIAGLVISILFKLLQGRTIQWIDHYIGYLRELEPHALGKYRMNRKVGEIGSTRNIAQLTSTIAICGWLFLIIIALNQYSSFKLLAGL